MANAVATTEMRINADTRKAQVQVGKLQGAMTSLKSRAVAPLGAGLASLSGTAARMSGASMGMSAGITAAAGSISLLGQTLGTIHPALLAITITMVAAAAAMALYKSDSEKLEKALKDSESALKTLAASTSEYAAEARELLAVNKLNIDEQIRATKAQIELVKSGGDQRSMLDAVIDGMIDYAIWAYNLTSSTQSASEALVAQQVLLAPLLAKLSGLQTGLDETSESWKSNTTALAAAAAQNESMNALLSDAVDRERERLRAQRDSSKAVIAQMEEERNALAVNALSVDDLAMAQSELTAKQQEAITTYNEAVAGLDVLSRAEREATKLTEEGNEAIVKQIQLLNERNDAILANEQVTFERAAQAAIDRTMNAEASLAALRTRTAFETTEQITIAFDALVEAEEAKFALKIENANVLAGELIAIEAERELVMAGIKDAEAAAHDRFNSRIATGAKKTAKFQMDAYAVAGNFFAKMISGQIKGSKSFAVFFVETIGSAVQATLQVYAALWAAEAVANAVSNPVMAASKAKAAAMAGAAIGVVGALTSAAASAITGGQDDAFADDGGVGDTVAQEGRTRQLIAKGPVNLSYVASQTIVGNVIGIEDVKEMFIEWNNELLRTAGMDAETA